MPLSDMVIHGCLFMTKGLKVVSNMLPYSGFSNSRKVEKAKARDEKTLLLRYFAGIC